MSAPSSPGRLIGIARREIKRAPMELLPRGRISVDQGLEGDCKGRKHEGRRVTVVSREAFDAARAELPAEAATLPWTARRANLLVEGVRLPRPAGGVLKIGPVVLEVTGQTFPCSLMDAQFPGLLSALAPEWRGGVTCRVLEGGDIALDDPVEILVAPVERTRVLP